MTNGNDPASPVMQPTGTFSGMTKREQMALTLTAAILAADNQCPFDAAAEAGVKTAYELIRELNKPTK